MEQEGIELCRLNDEDGQTSRSREEIIRSWVRRPEVVHPFDFWRFIRKPQVKKLGACMVVTFLLVVVLPILISKLLPKHQFPLPSDDEYTIALHLALRFFDAQKSGNISKTNTVPWRGNSGMKDGFGMKLLKNDLVGGYYDAGGSVKFHYPLAFSLTLLSWSVLEYQHKYTSIQEYEHVRDTIKWGTDYLMKTFDSAVSTFDEVPIQVGVVRNHSGIPGNHFCWQRPEDMDSDRPVQFTTSAPDLGSEMAAALAAGSMVFRDDKVYSKKLLKSAEQIYKFARAPGQNTTYSVRNRLDPSYNSSGYWDEFLWADTWMFYASGNFTYLSSATESVLSENSRALSKNRDLYVFSWDNKLPGAMLLLMRVRIFLGPGYPFEEMLRQYHDATNLHMCSYLQQNDVFRYTKGGLIQLNHGRPRPLQYVVNAVFLASLFVDYLNVGGVPGWFCGPYFTSNTLREFTTTQMNYVLGDNPMNISYVVGYGLKYPLHVHHRGASIPNDNVTYTCTGGWRWRDAMTPNPNIIYGAMVGGPLVDDSFKDVRSNPDYTEPTLAANAGLVAALVSLTESGRKGVDVNTMFMSVAPY